MPCPVAVVTDKNGIGKTFQKPCLFDGQRRTHRRHDVFEARIIHGNSVHIALDHDNSRKSVSGFFFFEIVDIVKGSVFYKKLGFLCVFVFREIGFFLEKPAAESYDVAEIIDYRYNQSSPQSVVNIRFSAFLFLSLTHPASEHFLLRISFRFQIIRKRKHI